MVSKLVSKKPACFERNSRTLSETSTSVKALLLLISFSSQSQNSARAAASLDTRTALSVTYLQLGISNRGLAQSLHAELHLYLQLLRLKLHKQLGESNKG